MAEDYDHVPICVICEICGSSIPVFGLSHRLLDGMAARSPSGYT